MFFFVEVGLHFCRNFNRAEREKKGTEEKEEKKLNKREKSNGGRKVKEERNSGRDGGQMKKKRDPFYKEKLKERERE